MVVRVTSSNLWTSPYSDYQQEVYDLIKTKHDEGLNFVQISDWLNDNEYKTPRGKVFSTSPAALQLAPLKTACPRGQIPGSWRKPSPREA
jgi:hypothetical protein